MYTPKRSFHKEKTRTPRSTFASPFTDDHPPKTSTKSSMQVIEKGENHQLVRISSGLPVNVSEEIAKVDTDRLNCSIKPNGWCLLLSVKKLFIWRLTSPNVVRKATSCLEFPLPSTELIHKINLVCLCESVNDGGTLQTRTSMLIASPEGLIRYWPDINKPPLYNEVNMNLNGKSCHALFSLKPYGFILATTTNELYSITATMSSIHFQVLSSQAGMLSSLSRRVSSFWVAAPTANKFAPCICDGTLDYDEDERFFFVIVDNMLQKWEVSNDQPAKMTTQHDLLHYITSYKNQTDIPLNRVSEIFAIEAKNTGAGLVILLSALIEGSQVLLLGTFKLAGEVCFEYIVTLDELSGSGLPTMVIPPGSYRAVLCLKRLILSTQLTKSSRSHIKVEFDSNTQSILGSGYFGSDPVFLCRRNGLISLKVDHYESPIKNLPKETKKASTTEYEGTQEENFDATIALTQAFKEYSKSETIYSSSRWSPFSVSEMCTAVVSVSETILNSSPATEPRWSSAGHFDKKSQPLLLFNQLKDKENVHGVYLKFLKVSGIWDEVLQHSSNVKYMLTDHGEKLQCTAGLLELYSEFSEQIDEVIGTSNLSGDIITKKDLIFSKVTDIGLFFSTLVQNEISIMTDTNIIQKHVENIIAVGEILTKSYIASWRYRQSIMGQYDLSPDQHVPWTGSSKGINNRQLLMKQIKIIFENALKHVDSTKVGSLLTQQVVLLADLLLDAFDKEIRMMKSKSGVQYDEIVDDFQHKRRYIIENLVNVGYLEEAMTLAEKYEDFFMLILLCERSNDTSKLEQYKVMFKDQGFLDVLYNYYMEQGAWGKLLSIKGSANEDYTNLLNAHPYLSWIHYIGTDEYTKASNSLKCLAKEEKVFSSRKKMMLVLSSLAALASDDINAEAQFSEVEDELEMIEHQNNLLKAIGRDSEKVPLIPPEDLIELCLGHRDNFMDEYFPSIFHTLKSVKDAQIREKLINATWCKCILIDRWEPCALLQLNDVVSNKTFTKALEYCAKNETYTELVMSLSNILSASSELSDRATTDTAFTQQLKACYELTNVVF